MSGQVTITQLPVAGALTGTEGVPIVQNGVTVQTTTGAIAGAGALNYPFLTVGSTAGLTQARYIATGSGLTVTDNGAGNSLQINLIGAALSLDNAGTGIIVKTGSTTVTNRLLTVGAGMTIANADGISDNPSIGLNANLQNLASLSGVGILAINGSTFTPFTLQGTTNQISIANGNAASGSPTISIYPNAILPGTGSVTVPFGTTAQRTGSNGALRYNTDTATFEAFANGSWGAIVSGSGVTTFSSGTTGLTPSTATSGGIILGGTLITANGGTGVSGTLTGYVYGNGASAMTGSTTIPTTALSGTVTNAQLANSAITINGNSVSLGASTTVTASTTSTLTIGTGLTGTSFNGSVPVTITIDSTVATLTGTQTLTNKSMSGSANTFTNIPNNALVNSTISGVPLGSNLYTLGFGTHLTGTSYNGSTGVTIGTDATSLNTASTIVARDGSGNFSAGAITATSVALTTGTISTAPVNATDITNKSYVDSVAQGLNAKPSVLVATTANITLSGEQTIDGVTTSASRVLVKNQTSQANNGIYLSGTGAWTRTPDANTWNELVSAFVFVEQGTTQADTGWTCTVDPGGTLGVTTVTWVQFSGAGTYSAGTGLTLTGTVFSLTNPVAVNLGGTGLASLTTGYIPYGNGTSAFQNASTFTFDGTNFKAPNSVTSGGHYSIGAFGGTYTDGIVMDYVTGNGRISVGSADGITFYNGGVATTSLGGVNSSGIWTLPTLNLTNALGVAYGGTGLTSLTAGSLVYGNGTSAYNTLAIGTSGQILTSTGTAPQWSTLSGVAVTTFSGGTTGLTPSTATSGAITLGGTLVVGNGGTGVATLTGLAYGNGTSAFTAATATQVVSVIGTTAVTNATNATNTGITAVTTGTTNYLTFVTATSGNLPQLVNSSITANAVNGTITGGIAGGAF